MNITNQEKLNEFKTFIDSIQPEDKLAVIYDTDMDGISSGVLAVHGLEALGKTVNFQRSRTPGTRTITQDLQTIFKEKNITKIIFLDLPIESYADAEKLNDYDVMVIDHHPTQEEHNKKFTIIKSFDLQTEVPGFKYCTAHMTYDLFSTMTDMSSWDWVVTTGIIGDITYTEHKAFVDSIFATYDVEIKENPFDTTIGELVQYSTYATCIGTQEEMNKIFNALYFSKTHDEAIAKLKHLTPVKEEFEKLINEFDEQKEIINNIIFYEFDATYYINSPVCTALSQTKVPNNTLLTVHFKDDVASISARRQDGNIHMGEMLRDCTKDLPNSQGGGHPVAAGAKVQKADYETFKKRIIEWVKEHGRQ